MTLYGVDVRVEQYVVVEAENVDEALEKAESEHREVDEISREAYNAFELSGM